MLSAWVTTTLRVPSWPFLRSISEPHISAIWCTKTYKAKAGTLPIVNLIEILIQTQNVEACQVHVMKRKGTWKSHQKRMKEQFKRRGAKLYLLPDSWPSSNFSRSQGVSLNIWTHARLRPLSPCGSAPEQCPSLGQNVATDLRVLEMVRTETCEAWIVLASSAYNISLWRRSISIALLE